MSKLWKSLGGLAAGAVAAYVLFIRPWHFRWGATEEESAARLAGDELVPEPRLQTTHAVTIQAAPSEVWPWIVQLGQGRGGFYSYDWIENLMRLEIHSADRILTEHQDLKVGDEIPLAPGGRLSIPVSLLEPERHLVMHGDTREAPAGALALRAGDFANVVWALHLRPNGDGSTRLIERWRADFNPSLLNRPFYRLFLEPGAFLMQRKMLLGIKERAERLHREAGATSGAGAAAWTAAGPAGRRE